MTPERLTELAQYNRLGRAGGFMALISSPTVAELDEVFVLAQRAIEAAPPSEAPLDTQLRTARTVWEEALRMVKAKQAELLIRADDPDPEDVLRDLADALAARLPSKEPTE